MGDPHRAVGGVDALAPGPAGAHAIDLEVLVLDLHVHVLGLGQHRDGGRRGVDPALGLGDRHALHPVHTALVLQPAVDLVAGDEGGRGDVVAGVVVFAGGGAGGPGEDARAVPDQTEDGDLIFNQTWQ